jgi:hypothetical protein
MHPALLSLLLTTSTAALAFPTPFDEPHTISILLYADPDCHTEPRALDVEPDKCYRFSGAQGAEVLSEDTGTLNPLLSPLFLFVCGVVVGRG